LSVKAKVSPACEGVVQTGVNRRLTLGIDSYSGDQTTLCRTMA
jgi:hypothetical protein